MKILLWTEADPQVATARMWFYDMAEMLRARGADVSLAEFTRERYDVAVVHWANAAAIQQILAHSPQCRIGIFNPGLELPPEILANVDFVIVCSFMWEELFLHTGRRIYRHFDFPSASPRSPKVHQPSAGPVVIGYVGGEYHYDHDMEPHLSKALQRLAAEEDILLRVVIPNAGNHARPEGVPCEFIEWEVDTHESWVSTFDVGICPSYDQITRHGESFIHIRNPNRVSTLLFESIPSVASPLFESCRYFVHGEHVFYASLEEGWYAGLKRLVTSAELRQEMGDAGRNVAEKQFNRERAAEVYHGFLIEEGRQIPFPKSPELLTSLIESCEPPATESLPDRMRNRLRRIKHFVLGSAKQP